MTSRSSYGDNVLFAFVWRRALYALEKSGEHIDFIEFKDKDTLQDKVLFV